MVTQQMIDAARMAGDNHTHSERADPNGYWRAALEAALAAAWVPVAERLPSDDEDVLLFGPMLGIRTGWHRHGWNLHESESLSAPTVTHWAPLPAPPKE